MTITRQEARIAYHTVKVFIEDEKTMRNRVFPVGHPRHNEKLEDCRTALASLTQLAAYLKQLQDTLNPPITQAPLLDEPMRMY